jgi:predicted TIM-barrel fold metal-dependent hydrolase
MGIEVGVLLPIVNSEIYFPQAVEDIVEISEKYPNRFIPYCNVDPRCCTNSPRAPLGEVIRYYKSLGCKGIGEVMPNLPLLDPLVQNLFACAEKENMPIVYDGSVQLTGDFGLYDDPGLPQLEYTLQEFPALKIFGHGPVFWNEMSRLETVAERGVFAGWHGYQIVKLPTGPIAQEGTVSKLFRKYSNLCGDLSDGTAFNAFARDEEYGPRFMTEFQDRLFFGTDMCFPDMPVELDKLLLSWRESGKISETVFRKIAYDNAAKLLGLN